MNMSGGLTSPNLPNRVAISGVTFKIPNEMTTERYKLSKSGRVASGDMTMDIIAKKRKFKFRYKVLSQEDLDTILALLDGEEAFYEFSYIEGGLAYTCTIYPGAITYKRFRTVGGWYYTDVSFDLIER